MRKNILILMILTVVNIFANTSSVELYSFIDIEMNGISITTGNVTLDHGTPSTTEKSVVTVANAVKIETFSQGGILETGKTMTVSLSTGANGNNLVSGNEKIAHTLTANIKNVVEDAAKVEISGDKTTDSMTVSGKNEVVMLDVISTVDQSAMKGKQSGAYMNISTVSVTLSAN